MVGTEAGASQCSSSQVSILDSIVVSRMYESAAMYLYIAVVELAADSVVAVT